MALRKPRPLPPAKVKARRVCGIDASTQSIAFTIFYNRRPRFWGKIKLEGDNIYIKAGDAAKKIAALLQQYDIDYVVIESAVFVNNVSVVKKLAYIYGSIIGAVAATGRRIDEVEPLTWQTAIGNPSFTRQQRSAIMKQNPRKSKSWYSNHIRELRKQRTMKFFNDKFDMQITDDDVGDSAGIAWFGYYKMSKR